MRRTPGGWTAFTSLVLVLVAGAGSRGYAQETGFFGLSGADAANFLVPADMELVRALPLPAYGLTYERYQQYFGPARARVLNGQITVFRDELGAIVAVIGAHYHEIAPRNAARLSHTEAGGVAERDIGTAGERRVELLIHPETGRFFFRVETRRFDSRWVHWIDADDGRVLKKYDALTTDHGIGVKGDVKSMVGLTTFHGSSGHGASGPHYDLFSTDSRQITYDARNRSSLLYYVTDADNHWTVEGRTSPGHPALIDAQYHANVSDDYFQTTHGLNWLACGYSGMQSVAHYSRNYNNAFWNGTYTVFGDGDGNIFRELSGGLDVVAHELTHGITDCTSNLIYQDESGALNESFSDMLGNSAEFFADESASTNCVRASNQSGCADWWIGEDVYVPADTIPGFRNMADPAEDGDPDHYSERQIGGDDNGGVHSNSGIPNHAYYLLVEGGRNAGCDAIGSNGHTHGADCGVSVSGIGLLKAERIFFQGFTGLPENATMCQARSATEAAAANFYGWTSAELESTTDAWTAVGLRNNVCGGGPPSDSPPSVSIVNPVEGSTISGTVAIQIDATDTEDAPGSLTVQWNVDGGPWQSTSFSSGSGYYEASWDTTAVSDGTHVVNARASDSASNTSTDSNNVAVDNPDVPASGMHVGDLDGSSQNAGNTWTATVTLNVHDENHDPVANASVSAAWSGGFSGLAQCTTESNGACSVTSGSIHKRNGSVSFTVTDVTGGQLAYVATDNHDPEGDSNGTQITVNKP